MKWACHNGFENWHLCDSPKSQFTFCGADLDDDDIRADKPPQNKGKRCKRCQEIRQKRFERAFKFTSF